MINQFFFMINQKIIRHTENFWGSGGSYSKTVRPNGFLYTDKVKNSSLSGDVFIDCSTYTGKITLHH
jgi:hypothetical protein